MILIYSFFFNLKLQMTWACENFFGFDESPARVVPSTRDLIEMGVNATASRKKKFLRNVRIGTRSRPVRPCSSYKVFQFELRDSICVWIITPQKSGLAEIIDFATQVWAIARVSALSLKIHFIFHLFHLHSGWNIQPTFLQLKIFGKTHSAQRSRSKDIWPDLISRLSSR